MSSASGSSWPQDGKKKRHKDATRNPTHVADFIGITGENRNEPGGIRTPDLLVRSQTLYPAELQARGLHYYARIAGALKDPCPARSQGDTYQRYMSPVGPSQLP